MTPGGLAVERSETLSRRSLRCRVIRDLEPARQANYYLRPSDQERLGPVLRRSLFFPIVLEIGEFAEILPEALAHLSLFCPAVIQSTSKVGEASLVSLLFLCCRTRHGKSRNEERGAAADSVVEGRDRHPGRSCGPTNSSPGAVGQGSVRLSGHPSARRSRANQFVSVDLYDITRG